MFDALTEMMSNLSIEEDEDDEMTNICTYKDDIYKFPINYNFLLDNIINIFVNVPNLTMEIIDNIIVIDNILLGLQKKPLIPSIDLNINYKDKAIYVPILQLPEFRDEQIPLKYDINWWDGNCDAFDECMNHLMNDTVECNYSLLSNNNIVENILELTFKLVQKVYVNKKIEYDIMKLYEIACYLERYFYIEKIGLFYSDKHDITSKYVIEFRKLALENINKSPTIYYELNNDLYIKNINRALLSVLNCSKNILILFGPYGIEAIQKNIEILKNLDFQAVFDFKREALRYFALNNLIIMKLNNKCIQLFNPNDYVNFIFKGSKFLN